MKRSPAKIKRLPQRQEFVFDNVEQGKAPILGIVNLNPLANEQTTYRPVRNQRVGFYSKLVSEDYVLISLLKGLGPKNKVLILAGIITLGTQAAAEYVTKPENIQELFSHLKNKSENNVDQSPLYFQAVLKVKVNDGVPVQVEYVTHHLIK